MREGTGGMTNMSNSILPALELSFLEENGEERKKVNEK
jgi:hypothetical protein